MLQLIMEQIIVESGQIKVIMEKLIHIFYKIQVRLVIFTL